MPSNLGSMVGFKPFPFTVGQQVLINYTLLSGMIGALSFSGWNGVRVWVVDLTTKVSHNSI